MNRTRSVLSGFTIAFAILLFTILFGIANGLQNTFKEAFVDDATNIIAIYTGKTTKAYKGLQAGRRIRMKNKDFDYIEDTFGKKIQYLTARIYKGVVATHKSFSDSYDMRAVHPDHQFLEKTLVRKGRYINQNDIQNKTKVVVIGKLIEEDLFVKNKSVGEYLDLNGIQFKVVGVFEDEGGDNEERLLYIPISTAQQIYGNNDYIDQINLGYSPSLNYNQAIAFGNALTKKLKDRFNVAKNDQRAVRVQNMAEATKAVDQMMVGLGVIILVIGFGTLIAGVVGVSNIMIFIVKERTKEIGIRKALGASPKSIISIILIEAILITAIAGYVGLMIGFGVLKAVGPSLEEFFIKDPSVSNGLVIGATLLLITAGAIAGYVPAKRASKIKPIVALRND